MNENDRPAPIDQYAAASATAKAASIRATEEFAGTGWDAYCLYMEAAGGFRLAAAMTRNPRERRTATRNAEATEGYANAAWQFKA